MVTTVINPQEPYGELISLHVKKEFPKVTKLNSCELLDVLTEIIIGSKEVRYGCLPTPESQVVIREVIRDAIESNVPIPILIPWGSIKANFTASLDIAEVAAIHRLIQLQDSLREFYLPGAEMVIRIEDTSGYTLFALEGDQAAIKQSIDSYSKDMLKLVRILNPSRSIRVQLESTMENAERFNDIYFSQNVDRIYNYLVATKDMEDKEQMIATPEYQELRLHEWRGYISKEQREHYLSTYRRIYDWAEDTNLKRLALYFAGAWRRFQLGMTGKQKHWDKFIQLAFIPPIKGLPEGYNFNYVYYRTLPLSEARTHICPWRAKGYLKINGNSITHKLASFSDTELISKLTPVDIVIASETLSVTVKADYYLEA